MKKSVFVQVFEQKNALSVHIKPSLCLPDILVSGNAKAVKCPRFRLGIRRLLRGRSRSPKLERRRMLSG